MKPLWTRVMAGIVACVLIGAPAAVHSQGAPALYAPPQIDQLVAPIALYPDQLLMQILMASTYPLEVVEASRWVQDPNNARLRGDQLEAALQAQDWDPSVKSLVPFPQILRMMDSRLDWMQKLGDAFLAQQADVMDSVQRLRAEAQAAGTLQSTPQQTVVTQGQTIVIAPANPQIVYVPAYNPMNAYGTWPYPAYPPSYFPPPWTYNAGPGIFFGIGIGIVGGLWGWSEPEWDHHRIHVDAHRYNVINNYVIVHENRPKFTGQAWDHDPYHRRGVPYRDPGARTKFEGKAIGSPADRHDFRGYDKTKPAAPPPAQRPPKPALVTPKPPVGKLPPETGHPPKKKPPSVQPTPIPGPPATVRRPPAFEGITKAPDTRAQSLRGQASRQSMPPPIIKPDKARPSGGSGDKKPPKNKPACGGKNQPPC